MAPIKFEENIREKLEERTIAPSAKGWDALANRLDEKPVDNRSKRFWVLGIAASLTGLLLLINGVVDNETKTIVVETEVEAKNTLVKEAIKVNNGAVLFKGAKKEDVLANTNSKTETINEEKAAQQIEKESLNTNTYIANKTINNVVDYAENNGATITSKDVNKHRNNNASLKTVNAEIIALNGIREENKPQIIEQSNSIENNILITSSTQNEVIAVTDNELDALLNNAKESIAKKTNQNVPLDYNELLQDVEDNLDETLRDKLLKRIKGGYRSIKDYVAERNE